MLANRVKDAAIRYGGYRALRWAQDHVVDRARLRRSTELAEFYRALVRPGDLCFDVGSNIGDVSVVLLELGAEVVAVDPQPKAMRELRSRLGANPRLTCVETALGSHEGTATFYLHDQVGTSSLIGNWQPGKVKGQIEVPVTTLDALIRRFGKPAYCKIDVEGYELEVLGGLSQPIDLISLEYHHDEEDLKKLAFCLDALSRLQPIRMNVVGHARAAFAWPDWVTRDEFPARLAGTISQGPEYAYGDVYVRSGGEEPPALR